MVFTLPQLVIGIDLTYYILINILMNEVMTYSSCLFSNFYLLPETGSIDVIDSLIAIHFVTPEVSKMVCSTIKSIVTVLRENKSAY